MPDESVQSCVTSPPYYGLRAYQTEPQIWDGKDDCDHVWGEELPYAKQDNRLREEKIAQGANVGSNQNFNDENTTSSSGQFCQCGAWKGELGLEPTFHLYLDHLIQIFREVKRVLKPDGTCWVNLGDSYAGSGKGIGSDHGKGSFSDDHIALTNWAEINVPRKSLMNIPYRFAIRMTDELGFVQRNQINWLKPSAMPSSAKDRFTVDFEPIFFFSKNTKYKFNQQIEEAITPAGTKGAKGSDERSSNGKVNSRPPEYHIYNGQRNKRTTWKVSYEPQKNNHYAAYPTKLVEPMILASTDVGDTVLDPFTGTGTTLFTALKHNRKALGIELQPHYVKIAEERLKEIQPSLI